MKQFILGALATAIGMYMVIKTESVLNMFGSMRWAEEKLSGRSRMGYKLIGLLVVIMGLLAVTGMFGGLARGALTAIFGGGGQ